MFDVSEMVNGFNNLSGMNRFHELESTLDILFPTKPATIFFFFLCVFQSHTLSYFEKLLRECILQEQDSLLLFRL